MTTRTTHTRKRGWYGMEWTFLDRPTLVLLTDWAGPEKANNHNSSKQQQTAATTGFDLIGRLSHILTNRAGAEKG